ncbi:hypothetical protein JHN52_40420, partial [Streptomyces sp. MBT97]|nr:hypothetical protein [Streptomyces sp. MBT97]
MADLDALRTRFSHALDRTRGPVEGPDPAPYADDLLARWQEPQRRYHTLTHLTEVLDREQPADVVPGQRPAGQRAQRLGRVTVAPG